MIGYLLFLFLDAKDPRSRPSPAKRCVKVHVSTQLLNLLFFMSPNSGDAESRLSKRALQRMTRPSRVGSDVPPGQWGALKPYTQGDVPPARCEYATPTFN